ncbi:putative G-patch domain protein [Xylariomycetidae sp. FL0641]|nr:putative G-patch domain protein [Xylariomycetidae sp. FL0641]
MASDEEDDYMNMTFGEEEPKGAETSLQRRQRLKREGEIKGRVKSKAELAAEEREAREAALSQSLLSSAAAKKSKGLAMMAKMGFRAGGALGSQDGGGGSAPARTEPIRPEVKDDRAGIGLDAERKRKLRDAAAGAEKRQKADADEYRERVRREREAARWDRQAGAAMKVCERLDEERGDASTAGGGEEEEVAAAAAADDQTTARKRTLSTRPLKAIPVAWRGLVRRREEAERDRRARHDLEQSAALRLPTYEDADADADDRRALGKARTEYVPVEDLEEADPELEEFEALAPDERLRRVVEFLRKEFHYCFWCKFEYPDQDMDGCPGSTEEEHD